MKPASRRALFEAVYARDSGRCVYCGIRARCPGRGVKRAADLATLDHVIPRARGGPLCEANLVLACQACNNARGLMEAEAFRAIRADAAAGAKERAASPACGDGP